jgi:hypothetical protein
MGIDGQHRGDRPHEERNQEKVEDRSADQLVDLRVNPTALKRAQKLVTAVLRPSRNTRSSWDGKDLQPDSVMPTPGSDEKTGDDDALKQRHTPVQDHRTLRGTASTLIEAFSGTVQTTSLLNPHC